MANNHPAQAFQQPSNGLGLAGFIVSLIGFISCGLIAPVGMVMSIVAMKREPKGFAIAGLILGILGSMWLLVFGLLVAVMGLGAVLAAVGIGAAVPTIKSQAEMMQLAPHVERYQRANGALPTAVTQMPNLTIDEITDEWGNAYLIVPDASGGGYEIVSKGPDGVINSGDELSYRPGRAQ